MIITNNGWNMWKECTLHVLQAFVGGGDSFVPADITLK